MNTYTFEKMTYKEIQEAMQKQGLLEVSDGGQMKFALPSEGAAIYTPVGVDWTGTGGELPAPVRLQVVRAYQYAPLYAEDGAFICAVPGAEIAPPDGWVWVVYRGELECAPSCTKE